MADLTNDFMCLPGKTLIGDLENKLIDKSHNYLNRERLVIDFSKCYFIEVAALLYILSLVKNRSEYNRETLFCLPQKKLVRDFFRVWRFPEALASVTNTPFRSLMYSKKDLIYFGESVDINKLNYAGIITQDPNGIIHRLLSSRFFSITGIEVGNEYTDIKTQIRKGVRVALDESKRWRESLIYFVLQQQLGDPAEYVHSRVIYETITNAVRHPKAETVKTASVLLQNKTKTGYKAHLSIVVWDDGINMIDTLSGAVEKGVSIRYPNNIDINFQLILENAKGEIISKKIKKSDFTPSLDSSEVDYLAATIFPGISSDIMGHTHWKNPDLTDGENNSLYNPGMGLYVLVNAIVDIFGGQVAFRTKNYFMNIRKATVKNAKYRIKIRKYDKNTNNFSGNLITIRLPLGNITK